MRAVYVHGGVSGKPKKWPPLDYAVAAGRGEPAALDAVEAALRAMEDDPALQAGFGSTLNLDGDLEMDAGIAEGHTGRCGGIANVTVRHPVSLARRVLAGTPHVLITGAGARSLGGDMEILADTSVEQRQAWVSARDSGRLGAAHYATPEQVETVGAVALDDLGHLAAASSTGGVFGKLPGRVGDAPVFGAGYYASAGVAAVGTGVGELFLETLACLRVGRLIEGGEHPGAACERVIDEMGVKGSHSAGVLALDASGRAGAAYRGGSWSVAGPEGRFEAVRRE